MEQAVILLTLRAYAQEIGVARVAQISGLTQGTLYRVLSASGNPRLSTLTRICDAMQVDLRVRLVDRNADEDSGAHTIL